ncbi:MAG TPA: DUF6445 family protein [Luteimonas sp.]|nr:DUF6445 family protein [Luteimonas sp.]
MQLRPHARMRINTRSIGAEAAPLLVIDDLVSDPDRLVRKAGNAPFAAPASMFPGLRAPAPLSYRQFLEDTLGPLLGPHFGLAPGRFAFPMCHYSLVTQAPARLQFLQRIPHFDSVGPEGLATVHYLFRGDWGGTAFYRHVRTGFESIDAGRHADYFACLREDSAREGAAGEGYIDGDTAAFRRIGQVDGVYNRLIVYRRNALHSGRIDNRRVPPADPTTGRLSINSFIDLVR